MKMDLNQKKCVGFVTIGKVEGKCDEMRQKDWKRLFFMQLCVIIITILFLFLIRP